MSEISDKTNILIAKLATRFPTYNITETINPDGYSSPFIVIHKHYSPSDPDTTAGCKKNNMSVDLLIGKEYEESTDEQGETTAEEIETVIETILKLSYDCSGDITVDYDYNKDRPCRDTQLTLTL